MIEINTGAALPCYSRGSTRANTCPAEPAPRADRYEGAERVSLGALTGMIVHVAEGQPLFSHMNERGRARTARKGQGPSMTALNDNLEADIRYDAVGLVYNSSS